MLAGIRVQAINEAGEVADEEQSFRRDRHGRDAAIDLLEIPNFLCFGDITSACWIDANEVSDAFAVFGILADRHIDTIFPEDRCGIDFAWPFRIWIANRFSIL